MFSNIDHILGRNAVKRGVFQHLLRSRCPGSKIEYTRFSKHMFRTSSILAPQKLDSSRLIKELPPALKIEDLPDFVFENLSSWPALKCKGVNVSATIFPPAQMQAMRVHIHNLILTTCTRGLSFGFFKSALRAIQGLDGRLKILGHFPECFKYVLTTCSGNLQPFLAQTNMC